MHFSRPIVHIASATVGDDDDEDDDHHDEMNDEYDSQGERSVSAYEADLGVNTTSVTDPNNVKWKHHIEDLTNVPGYH